MGMSCVDNQNDNLLFLIVGNKLHEQDHFLRIPHADVIELICLKEIYFPTHFVAK